MVANKKQHTSPRSYLARFREISSKPLRNPPVWYFPINDDRPEWRLERVKKISRRDDYYTYENAPVERRLGLEMALGSIEQRGRDAITTIAAMDEPKPETVVDLAFMVVSMYVRSPAKIDAVGSSMIEAFTERQRQRYEAFKRDPSQIPGFLNHLRASGQSPPETDDPEDFNPDQVPLRHSPSALAAKMLTDALNDLVPILYTMRWDFLFTTIQEPFITSDTPVFIRVPGLLPSASMVRHPKCEITFPMTRQVAVLIRHDPSIQGEAVGRWSRAARSDVKRLNFNTAATAHEFLVASSTVFPGSSELMDKARDHRTPQG